MLTKFQRCRGLRLFRWGRFQIELWYCPAKELIPWHCHPNIKSTYVHLRGTVNWHKKFEDSILSKEKLLTNRNFGFTYTLTENVYHAAYTFTPLLFLNIERWACTPSSAAIDFKAL